MSPLPRDAVIAVDAGGTRSRFALAAEGGEWRVDGGAANASSDPHGAAAAIADGLARLAAAAGLSVDALAEVPAYLGVAGVDDQAAAGRLATAVTIRTVRIEDDRLAAVVGALGPADGALAHLGTGSFFARRVSGRTRLVGGWGADLADEASAQWIGRRALRRTLDVADSLADPTPLTDGLLARFGDAPAIVAFAVTARPSDFGALAPAVTQAADLGDANAVAILRDGAAIIAATLERLGCRPGEAICLTGGAGPRYAPYLPPHLAPGLVAPLGEPIDGALRLARAFAQEVDA